MKQRPDRREGIIGPASQVSLVLAALASACAIDFARYRHVDGAGGAATGAGGSASEGGAGMVAAGAGGSLTACGNGDGRCVTVPDGWNGPVWLQESSDVMAPLACPGSLARGDVFRDLIVTGGCGACSCAHSCNIPSLVAFAGAGCTGNQQTVQPAVACTNFAAQKVSFTAGAESTTCTKQGGAANFDPPTWTTRAVLCHAAPAPGECAEGSCFPAGTAPFEAGVCVWRDGDHPCPPGFGAIARPYYDAFTDTRGCTACQCGVASQCSVTLYVHNQSDCPMGFGEAIDTPQGCTDTAIKRSYRATVANGTCQLTQNTSPTGSAEPDPAAAHTVCCSE